ALVKKRQLMHSRKQDSHLLMMIIDLYSLYAQLTDYLPVALLLEKFYLQQLNSSHQLLTHRPFLLEKRRLPHSSSNRLSLVSSFPYPDQNQVVWFSSYSSFLSFSLSPVVQLFFIR